MWLELQIFHGGHRSPDWIGSAADVFWREPLFQPDDFGPSCVIGLGSGTIETFTLKICRILRQLVEVS
jgi:hypothetical protein